MIYSRLRRKALEGILGFFISLTLPNTSNAELFTNITIDNWPPFEYIVKNREGEILPTGSSVLIVNEILNKLNQIPQYKTRPWARGINELINGKIDLLLSGRKTKEREEIFDFSKKPIGCISWQVYSLYGNQNLKEGNLGLIEGYSYPNELLNLFSFGNYQTNIPDNINLIKMLEMKRIDYAILDETNFNKINLELNTKLIPIANTKFYSPLYILISKKWRYTQEFNEVLTQMYENGRIDEILTLFNIKCPINLPPEGEFAHKLK